MIARQLEIFRCVMRVGSTAKAAKTLGISQPAVSQSIKQLELHAGFALFNRARSRLEPTHEAQALLAEVDRAFIGLDAIEHRIRSLRDGTGGVLSIAVYPALGLGFMPRALARFTAGFAKHAAPKISLQLCSSKEVLQRVRTAEFDFGLMADELAPTGVDHSVFATMPAVVVLPKAHPLTKRAVITVKQLARYWLIALNPEDAARTRLEALFAETGETLNVKIETPYAASVCAMVREGLGVGVVNPLTALDYAGSDVVLRPLASAAEFTSLLVIPPGRPLSNAARLLISAMRSQLALDLSQAATRFKLG
jgi:DNA-binding transcriptional LysR family regulator